eukprot:5869936-Prymnesium_polylepis.1
MGYAAPLGPGEELVRPRVGPRRPGVGRPRLHRLPRRRCRPSHRPAMRTRTPRRPPPPAAPRRPRCAAQPQLGTPPAAGAATPTASGTLPP